MLGLAFGVTLDVVAIWAITSILARRNMSELMLNFVLFALGLIAVGVFLDFAHVEEFKALGDYLIFLFLGIRFAIGAPWLTSLVGSVLFVVYKFLISLAFAALRGS